MNGELITVKLCVLPDMSGNSLRKLLRVPVTPVIW